MESKIILHMVRSYTYLIGSSRSIFCLHRQQLNAFAVVVVVVVVVVQNTNHDDSLFLLAWTTNRTQRVMVAFSYVSTFEMRLPAGIANTSLINIIVQIRDRLNCVAEYHISSVVVMSDKAEVNQLADVIRQQNTQTINMNPTVKLLASGDPNTIAQVIISISNVLNDINKETVATAVSSE
jgi:hypothetical protein